MHPRGPHSQQLRQEAGNQDPLTPYQRAPRGVSASRTVTCRVDGFMLTDHPARHCHTSPPSPRNTWRLRMKKHQKCSAELHTETHTAHCCHRPTWNTPCPPRAEGHHAHVQRIQATTVTQNQPWLPTQQEQVSNTEQKTKEDVLVWPKPQVHKSGTQL